MSNYYKCLECQVIFPVNVEGIEEVCFCPACGNGDIEEI